MSMKDMKSFVSRLDHLKKLSQKLCEKERHRSELEDCRNWVLTQLNLLLQMSENDDATKEDLSERIRDIVCVLDPEED